VLVAPSRTVPTTGRAGVIVFARRGAMSSCTTAGCAGSCRSLSAPPAMQSYRCQMAPVAFASLTTTASTSSSSRRGCRSCPAHRTWNHCARGPVVVTSLSQLSSGSCGRRWLRPAVSRVWSSTVEQPACVRRCRRAPCRAASPSPPIESEAVTPEDLHVVRARRGWRLP
jgi:hypothetical protein